MKSWLYYWWFLIGAEAPNPVLMTLVAAHMGRSMAAEQRAATPLTQSMIPPRGVVSSGSLFDLLFFKTDLRNAVQVEKLQDDLLDFAFGLLRKGASRMWDQAKPYCVYAGIACIILYCVHRFIHKRDTYRMVRDGVRDGYYDVRRSENKNQFVGRRNVSTERFDDLISRSTTLDPFAEERVKQWCGNENWCTIL